MSQFRLGTGGALLRSVLRASVAMTRPRRGGGWALLLLALAVGLPAAGQQRDGERVAALDREEIARVISRVTGDRKVDSDHIDISLVEDYWELASDRPADGALLISLDGVDLVLGRVYDNSAGRLLEISGSPSRARLLADFGAQDFIAFAPEPEQGPARAFVWVYTDVTCPFCRRLHGDREDYLELGIELRYLPYPRFGKGSESWARTSRAWCADDRKAALTALKRGQDAGRDCTSGDTLDRYTEVADRLGVRATPTLVLEDGRKIDGLVDAETLEQLLFADPSSASP